VCLYIIYNNKTYFKVLFFLNLPSPSWGCLGVWLWLLFKVFFTQKSVPTIFFLFFKNYFWDQYIKIIWKHQKYITSKQKKIKIKIFLKILFNNNAKHPLIRWLGVNEYEGIFKRASPKMKRTFNIYIYIK
jgi:hypothetical protein